MFHEAQKTNLNTLGCSRVIGATYSKPLPKQVSMRRLFLFLSFHLGLHALVYVFAEYEVRLAYLRFGKGMTGHLAEPGRWYKG